MSTILLLIVLLTACHIEGTAVCTRKLDIVFIVDVSSTICGGTEPCRNWKSSLQFIKNIVDSLNIGQDDSRVAFVTFSDEAHVEWGSDKHKDKTSLLSAIDGVAYTGGELKKTGADPKIITENIFNPKTWKRFGVPKVLIAISDGVKNIDAKTAGDASIAIQMAGIKMFMVCVTERCSESFAQIVTSPPKQANENYFLVANFLSIDGVRENLVKQICAS